MTALKWPPEFYDHTRHVRRLFILGAGFSCSVANNFPVTRDLLEALFDEDPQLPSLWAGLSSYFAAFLRIRSLAGDPELVSVLTALEAYRAIAGKAGSADAQIREVQTRVLYAAVNVLDKLSHAAQSSKVLANFVARLDPDKDAIITTNWDLVLEHALRTAGVRFQHDIYPSNANSKPNGLLVVKPQGSINWARMTPVSSFFHAVIQAPPRPGEPSWVLSERASMNPPPTFGSPGSCPADPAIIPPGFLGEDRSREINWSGYFLNIATYLALQAECIVPIGYSLPPDDFHILASFSFGLPQDSWGGGSGVRVFVVDPSPQTYERWRSAFHGTATNTHSPISVRHWARDLASALTRTGGPW